jgi:RNA polymerase sigma-70 factor, ECF subfamily
LATNPPPDVTDVGDAAHEAPIQFELALTAILSSAYGYAFRLTRNRADAEDLVQEAALLACRGRAGFEVGTNFKAWFFRIVTTCFWGKHRQESRRPTTIDFDDAPALQLYQRSVEAGLPLDGANPAEALFNRIGEERVAEALSTLPAEFEVVCTLYFMEDFAYQEIADVLSVPVGTVRSRLHRGRKMLQKALWHVAADAGIVSGSPGDNPRMPPLRRFTCEEAFRRLDDYLDGELSGPALDLVVQHLELCDRCAREFNFEGSVLDGIRAKLRSVDVPAAVVARFSALIHSRIAPDESPAPP